MTQAIYKQAVRTAFGNFVMVNQTLVKHFKDANPALLLGYLIGEDQYLEREKKLDQYGYFYCTSQKLEEKYGYSYKVQDRLIDLLVEEGLIEVVVKRKEGSESISKVKHFKIIYENVSNLVNGVERKPEEVSELPDDLLDIENALKTFAKENRARYQKTGADQKILNIAKYHGLNSVLINNSIAEKHKRIKGKSVTAKYLLTAFIPDISEHEDYVKPDKPKVIMPVS